MTITNNQVGPSGNSPNTGSQFRTRDTVVIPPGEWVSSLSFPLQESRLIIYHLG